ncbi:Thioredoxin-2 [Linnemannia zychae]|nr:Thioredoxin-2 [Linnemannia zychae]
MASCPIPANRTPYRPTPAEYNKASPFILSPNTEEELEAIQIEHKNRLLILVFTTAWCKNCKRLSNGIEQLAEDLSKIATFVHVDVDELVRTVKKHNVEATPTFAIARGHVLQSTITAAQLPRKATYEEMDDQLLEWISTTVRSLSQHWNGTSYSKITDHLAFAPTPTEAQIHDGLINVGFKTVIGMESKQNPGEYFTKEKDIWTEAGVNFVSYPIKSADEIGLQDFDEILQLVETMQGPILIHSEIGQVAAIMVFVMVAKQNARQGSEVPGWARELGFDLDGLGRLTQTICAWVDK